MLREHFVGTTFETDTTGMSGWPEGKHRVLINAFLGEGAQGVVFGIAPPDDPAQTLQALKIFKPAPFLEMQTLHHGFTVHTGLYPDHPLAMSGADRLTMLKNEMMPKVDDAHLVFRIEFYREIIDATVTVLAMAFAEATEPVSLDASPAREWLDDNVLHRVTELLDEDRVLPEFGVPLQRARDELDRAIAHWQAAGTYAPVSRNPFVTLTGLLFEDFINDDEYRFLSRSPEFAARTEPRHVGDFFQAIATFYYRLSDHGESGPGAEALARVPAAVSACDLLLDAGALVPERTEWFAALARAWKARFLILAKEPIDVVEPLLQSALKTWRTQGDLAQCHDALKFLASAYWPGNPETTVRYLNEAERIRHLIDRA
ncbi:hypothetical protein [Amycolatopsis taiwanensis]|uniref:hypothetical protein n=1 Tax=Amycolatopsis taiwanensis TaxID=342230 RepID=UPI000489E62E|nr:hypothetical protein [Amycolatopsis taiwanensis]